MLFLVEAFGLEEGFVEGVEGLGGEGVGGDFELDGEVAFAVEVFPDEGGVVAPFGEGEDGKDVVRGARGGELEWEGHGEDVVALREVFVVNELDGAAAEGVAGEDVEVVVFCGGDGVVLVASF